MVLAWLGLEKFWNVLTFQAEFWLVTFKERQKPDLGLKKDALKVKVYFPSC